MRTKKGDCMKVIDTITWDGKLIKRVIISDESPDTIALALFYSRKFDKETIKNTKGESQ